MNEDSEKTILRVAVLTVFITILFNILEYIPKDKTYEVFNIEMGLKLFASTFFTIILIIFLLYLLILLLNLGYRNKFKFEKLSHFLFDVGVTLIVGIALIEFSIFILLSLMIKIPFFKPGWFSNIWLIVTLILVSIFSKYNLKKYFLKR